MESRKRTLAALTVVACFSAGLGAQSPGPALEVIGRVENYRHTAVQAVQTGPMATTLCDEHVVRFPGRSWLQLELEKVTLHEGSTLEIRSLADGDTQIFNRNNIRSESAYFNGDALRIRLWAAPGTCGNSYSIKRVAMGGAGGQSVAGNSCSGVDNRSLSNDKRVARLVRKNGSIVVCCTAFLISRWNCFATAGHAMDWGRGYVVQFNVPASNSAGSPRHPPSEDQYNWTGAHGYQNLGHGADWALFTVEKNWKTEMYPGEAQGAHFTLSPTAMGTSSITVKGYGIDHDDPERSQVQQTTTASFHSMTGTMLRYGNFTLAGDSGSPVIGSDGFVHAVHTGCIGNSRVGTRVTHSVFQTWLATLCREPRRPDLEAESMQTSAGAGVMVPGSSYTFQSRVVNAGATASPATASGYYLSSDSTVSTSDTLVAGFTTIALSPNQKHTHSLSVKLPTNLNPGRRWPGVCFDRNSSVAENFEQNNSMATTPVTISGLADFEMTSVQSDAFFIWPGKEIRLTAKVKNAGDGAAGFRRHGFYLSRDAVITPVFDVLLSTFSTAAMAPLASRTVAKQITLPSANVFGLCYLGAYADDLQNATERSETNNSASIAAQCDQAPCPDLAPSGLQVSTTKFEAGSLVELRSMIRNLGTAAAPLSMARYYISQDRKVSIDDTVLWTAWIPGLVRFGFREHTRTVQIPTSVTSGPCWLLIVADYDDRVAECKEDNNIQAIAVTCVGKPDLIVPVIDVPAAMTAGDWIAFGTRTKNRGTAAARPSVTGIFLSSDSSISSQDTYLGSHSVPSLSANAEHAVTVQVRLPYSSEGGSAYIGALADSRAGIAESIETNNGRSAPVSIAAYAGSTRVLEWQQPRDQNQHGPYTSADARYVVAQGANGEMCLVAPGDIGKFYVCLLSASSAPFVPDAWSDVGLAFLGGPFFPAWFGTIPDSGKAFPKIALPGFALAESQQLYVHVLFLDDFGADGFASNAVGLSLYK